LTLPSLELTLAPCLKDLGQLKHFLRPSCLLLLKLFQNFFSIYAQKELPPLI
jgi:hypothetical protein